MAENKKEEVPGTSKQSIKMDILMFKDDILKDMREIQRKLDAKYFKSEENLNMKITKFETKISIFEQKIFELSNKISTDNKIRENVESLNKFKEETSDTLFKRRVKINDLEKMMKDEISRFNDILNDSVVYPSIIGGTAKFKTFHDFMDYVLEEIAQFKIYKDKTGLDITPFKKKIEHSIEAMKVLISNSINISNEFARTAVDKSEEGIKSLLKIYDDRLQDARVENSHYKVGLEKKNEELKNEINHLNKIQEELNKKFENHLGVSADLEGSVKYYNNEIISLNNKINKLNSLIKDLLNNYDKNDKTTKSNEKKGKIFSGVKQYINGLLDANELSTMKNFKKYDNSFGQNIKRTTTEISKSVNIIKKFDHSNTNNKIDNDDESKIFIKKKTTNYFNDDFKYKPKKTTPIVKDLFQSLYNKENISNEFKQKAFSRRGSYNLTTISSFQKLKFNDGSENIPKKSRNTEILDIDKANTSGKKKLNTQKSLNFLNSSNSSNESKKDSVLNLSEEIKNDNTSKQSNKKNQDIIKEEDENNASENSLIKIKEENRIKPSKKNIQENSNKNNQQKENEKINKEKNISQNIEKDNNNKINSPEKVEINTNNSNTQKNLGFKIGLNSLRKSKEINNIPLLDILNYVPIESQKVRAQSSKKRNISSINPIYKNLSRDNYIPNKNDPRLLFNSYNNTYIKTNSNKKLNKEYQNFPYLNEIIGQKVESLPNSLANKSKLIKFGNSSINNNISQTFNTNNYTNSHRTKKLKLGSPENIFSNAIAVKRKKKIIKNKSVGMGYERSNEAKQIENLFNKLQSYIPNYESNIIQNDIGKSFKKLKPYKTTNKKYI